MRSEALQSSKRVSTARFMDSSYAPVDVYRTEVVQMLFTLRR